MDDLRCRPMAVAGFFTLAVMFAAFAADKAFLCAIISLCFGAALAAVVLISGKLSKLSVLIYLSAALIFSGVMLMSCELYCVRPAQKYAGTSFYVTAKLTDKNSDSYNTDRYILKTETIGSKKISSSMILYTSEPLDYEPGSIIGFTASLEKAGTGGSLQSRLYLKSENVVLCAYSYDGEVKLIKQDDGIISSAVYKLRRHIKTSLEELLPGDTGAAACAMLTGDKSRLSDAAALGFSLAGVSHLFAVSGLHLSVWVLSVYELLKKLGVQRKLNSLFAVMFTLGFMALTGFTASVCRAGVMLMAVMLGRSFGGKRDALNSLGLACVILLAAKPYCAVSLSLLLSLSATVGIVTVYPFVQKNIFVHLNRDTPPFVMNSLKAAISLFVITLSAAAFTLPVNTFIVGRASLAAPVTNLLVSFAATACMISGGIAAIFSGAGFICRPAGLVCGVLARYVLSLTSVISKSPVTAADLNNTFAKAAVIVFITGVTVIMIITQNSKKRLKAIAALLVCVSVTAYSSFLVYYSDKTIVEVFNVGDGISACVRSAHDTMAVGCGGSDYYSSEAQAQSLGLCPDRLILPDENRWSTGSMHCLSSQCRFKHTAAGYDSAGVDLLFDNAVHSHDLAFEPWSGASARLVSSGGNSYVYCVFDGRSVLFIFNSGEDFTVPKQYSTADVLILSYYPPAGLDLSGFGNIIISSSPDISDSFTEDNPYRNFISTSDYEKISIELKSENITINCQGR